MTIAEFAGVLGVSTRTVDNWEARAGRISPRPEIQRALDTALTRADAITRARFAAYLTPLLPCAGSLESMSVGLSPVPLLNPLPWLVWSDPHDRVDDDQLSDVVAYMRHLIEMDNTLGSAGLAPLAVAQFTRLRRRFEDSKDSAGRQAEVVAVLSELAEVAGWLAFDDADQETTMRMNRESLRYSDLIGEQRVRTLTLQNSSMQAGFLGRPRDSLAIADSVLEGPGSLSPRLRSLFLTRRARALAQGGDESALHVFAEARHLHLDGVTDRDPDWTWWVDDRELSWHEAMILTDLGDRSGALRWFEHSVSMVPVGETRSRYLHLAYLLGAEVAVAAWSDTGDTIERLIPLVRDVASRRTHLLLRQLIPTAIVHAPPRAKDSFEQLHRILNVVHGE